MEKWNAIDLHMHTFAGITRDKKSDIVNFSYQKYVDVLLKYKIQLCAVTNHNVINFENYIILNYLASLLHRNILLGVELDTITDSNNPLHIVTIFKKNFEENLKVSNHINSLTKIKNNDPEIIYSSDDIVDLLRKYDSILIPHGIKSKGIFEEASEINIMEALKKVKERFIRIFDSPSNWKLEQIKDFLSSIGEEQLDQFGGVLFSDIRDWDNYDKKYRNFYMNAEPTFKGLVHSITNPTRRFKKYDSINVNDNYISKIVLKANNNQNRIIETTLNFNNDYNCIIGKSGSGKSLLLNLIKRELISGYSENMQYDFAKNTNVEIYNEKGIFLNPNIINVDTGASLYDKIIRANASNDNEDIYSIIELINNKFIKREKFNKFLEDYKKKIMQYCKLLKDIQGNEKSITEKLTELNSKISQKKSLMSIKVFNINISEEEKTTYTEGFLQQFAEYEKYITSLKNLLVDCKENEKQSIIGTIERLNTQMYSLNKKMILRNLLEKHKVKKISTIKKIIESINGNISQKAQLKTKLTNEIPNNMNNLVELIKQNFINKLKIDSFSLNITTDDIDDEKIVNSKHNIVVKEKIAIDLTKFNIKDNKIFNTYGKKTMLEDKIFNLTDPSEAKKVINKYAELNLINDNKSGISDDFDVTVQILFDGQDVNELNPGTIAKTYISIYFEEEIKGGKNNVILFDQIENDVDKPFISDVLRELIEDTKGYVQIIIVTHDPIVAVNADPTNYIECIRDKDKFYYRSFCPECDDRDELNTIAKNVDGSKEVIKNRYEIYGGENIL